jgi:hypothetical protein
MNHRRPHLLGDKGNEFMIVFFQKVMFVKEIPNTAKNHRFDKGSIFLIKETGETIRTKSLCSANAKEGVMNFLLRRYGTKGKILLRGDSSIEEIKELLRKARMRRCKEILKMSTQCIAYHLSVRNPSSTLENQ